MWKYIGININKKYKIFQHRIDNIKSNKDRDDFVNDRFYSTFVLNIGFLLCIYITWYNINQFIIFAIYALISILVLKFIKKNKIKNILTLFYIINIIPSFMIILIFTKLLINNNFIFSSFLYVILYITPFIYYRKKVYYKSEKEVNVEVSKYIGIVSGAILGGILVTLDEKIVIILWLIYLGVNLIIIKTYNEIKYVLKNNEEYNKDKNKLKLYK